MTWIDWDEVARDELADIWVAATVSDRDTIAAIVENTIRDIERDSLDVGESRQGNLRLAIHLPMSLWFRVFKNGQVVRIVHVRRIPKRG
jgi:hypothetical protein